MWQCLEFLIFNFEFQTTLFFIKANYRDHFLRVINYKIDMQLRLELAQHYTMVRARSPVCALRTCKTCHH